MADAGIFIGWDYPIYGREEISLKVFGELIDFLEARQRSGDVESFEPALLQPHGGDLGGFVIVRGDRARLDAMVASDEFQRLALRAQSVVTKFGVVNLVMGGQMQRQMGSFLQDTADLRSAR